VEFGATRLFDIVFALACLIFLAPLMITVAVLIRVVDQAPPVFEHTRIGRNGRNFKCLKFRSMRLDADERLSELLSSDPDAQRAWDLHHKLPLDPRITPLGRFLRRSSLDELPQFINVLRGDMSLVGPRPIIKSEISRYGRYFEHYCRVRPGVTGLWQVSGRSEVTYRRRVAMDVLYIRNRSLWLNIRICLRTLPAVLLQKGSV
jgi:exopolysaccharide production protein ExoY